MRPVQIALRLIEALSANQPAGVTELAHITGVPRSTAQRALVALHRGGWIEVADEGRGIWSLSLRALVAAGRATETHGALRDVAIPVMESLRRATGETVHLMVRQGASVVLVERLDGVLNVDQFRPFGSDMPIGRTVTGLVILATLKSGEVETLMSDEAGLDLKRLRRMLKDVRRQGYAVSLDADGSNAGAVAAAIAGADGRAFASIAVSGPRSRMTPERGAELGPLVADAARKIGVDTTLPPRSGD